MTEKLKQIFKVTLTFEIFVSATDKNEAHEKLLHIDPKKVYNKMNYIPGSIVIEPTPYELLDE